MAPLSNLAARDVETLVHPYTNLATFRENGPMVIERGEGDRLWEMIYFLRSGVPF